MVTVGSALPNGAIVRKVKSDTPNEGVVLAAWARQEDVEFVTWKCNMTTGDCYCGHYFREYDSANEDYHKRN